jgi:hypothetical protein
MHNRKVLAMTIAVASCAFLGSLQARVAYAQSTDSTQNSDSPAAQSEAAQMVPASALLAQDLDTKKIQPGQQFKAILSDRVQLKSGIELPKGTTLVGTIATGDASQNAKTTLALRFTQASLKDGKTIPIEATIVGISQPYDNLSGSTSDEAPPSEWNGKSLQFDIDGVLTGVDLHSRIAGENSGVFESAKKGDVKLKARTQIALALGAQGTNSSSGY